MINKSGKKQIIISLAATVGVLALEITLLVFLAAAVSREANEAAEKKSLALVYEEEQADFSDLEKDYAKISPYLPVIQNVLPGDDNLFRSVEALENLALKHGLSLSLRLESQTSLPSKIVGVKAVPFSASFTGNYQSLRDYLAALETLPVFAGVEAISINGQSIFSDSPVNLKGIIYAQ